MHCQIVFRSLVTLSFSCLVFAPVFGQERMLLWPDGAPGALGDADKDKPTLTAYTTAADKNVKTAVVVCPGGGYGHLAVGHEGKDIGEWFNSFGVQAFVLEYRHKGRGYQHPAPLQDVQHAIRTVRANADKYGIDSNQVGVMGFSAGGHLASSAATHFDFGDKEADDAISQTSCRPDFAILCYPVIAFGEPYTHRGSQRNLLGEDAPAELVKSFSNEKQVAKDTPPTFLFHTHEDTAVPPQNSIMFYLALKENGVPAELHLFEKGRHGVGLGKGIPGTEKWSELCEKWLAGRGLLGEE
jgi:acetyl esterase/lipase